MKKILLFAAFGLCCLLLVGRADAKKPKSIQDIQVKEATIPSKPIRPRSLEPYTTACVNYGTQFIEAKIDSGLGMVKVTVTDESGNTVYEATVDSDLTPLVRCPLSVAGTYRMTVTGEEYLAEGDFTIE